MPVKTFAFDLSSSSYAHISDQSVNYACIRLVDTLKRTVWKARDTLPMPTIELEQLMARHYNHTLSPCFTPVRFGPIFYLTPLLPTYTTHILGLTPFGWLRSIKLAFYFWSKYDF